MRTFFVVLAWPIRLRNYVPRIAPRVEQITPIQTRLFRGYRVHAPFLYLGLSFSRRSASFVSRLGEKEGRVNA